MANGIIIIDKPADWTSMDVCAKLRGILKTKKVGHAGTLDPMATGVLPIFVGRATRAVEFFESAEKEYLAGLRLGLSTNTQDITGEPLSSRAVQVARPQLEAVLSRFTGPLQQTPPMYSAVKIRMPCIMLPPAVRPARLPPLQGSHFWRFQGRPAVHNPLRGCGRRRPDAGQWHRRPRPLRCAR